MDQWIAPDRIFDGHVLRSGDALRIRNGEIDKIAPAPDTACKVAGLVTPGFVDLQVNGGGGVMLNTTPTCDGIAAIAAAHHQFGTTTIMPTVITDDAQVLDQVVDAMLQAKSVPGVAGLHIEGPHISVARRGTHAAKFVRPMDDRTMTAVARLRAADIRVMITLAPEAATLSQIAALAKMDVTVSLGHTDATAEAFQDAIAAGASCATHLFNAMSPMLGRAPGAVGAAINSDCYAGIICDGQHVADSMVGMAIRARPVPDRMFLVSDAMATVGGPDTFDLYGKRIALQDGRLVNAEGSLAGAHVTQAEGVKRLVTHTGTPLQTALRMATTTPAGCINAPALGALVGQPVDDVVLLNDDLSFTGYLRGALEKHHAST